MADDDPTRKRSLRAAILSGRDRMPGEVRAQAGAAICGHGLAQWHGGTTIAAYVSVAGEPPTRNLLNALLDRGIRVFVPVIERSTLDWALYTGPDELITGPFGLSEPTTPRLGARALDGADVVVVPALAVDLRGNRLGRGRGFYDRALIGVSAPVVAVVYNHELIDEVPTEPHDRRVDAILRPAGYSWCEGGASGELLPV